MVQPDPKPRNARRNWREAALGGVLMALGGALFGASKGAGKPKAAGKPGAKPAPRSRPDPSRSKVRTKPNAPEVAAPTRHWPPPPKPLDVYDDGIRPPEQAVQNSHLPVDEAARKRGYEGFDVKPGTVVKVMLSSVVVVVGCIAGLFYLIGRQHREDLQGPALTRQQRAVIVPPGPRLQDHPLHDVAMEKKRETDLLSFYAWTGPDHRAGRIPIARAQALVVGRPLDPLPSAAAAGGSMTAPEPAP